MKKMRLGDAEFEIMMVLWQAGGAVDAKYVLSRLPTRRTWVLPSLMSSLAKLCDKGFVACDRTLRLNHYTAIVSEDDYKAAEGGKMLNTIYGNSLENFVSTLHSKNVIGDTEIAELRKFLDEFKSDGGGANGSTHF